jgi:hypothetical protein
MFEHVAQVFRGGDPVPPTTVQYGVLRCAGLLRGGRRTKNWLFFGSEEAGQRSAVMYTLIENCRLHGIEPYAYLKDVLECLPRTTNQQVAQLTPLNWKKARQSQLKQAA